ncbi:hypothetical protein NEHOM01_2368 [Nematocida homosporus]|uniref:uncharacterized protein n=1 Tax=Nematocida homosporus TaxID=1912981 RepID=UPI00221EE86D|nr:uncharacterized protein NEHOM01_2368 [Nematocida homosporus]KAI5187789.1 hypothetical protein NEHOM01_2368 [Nematocida homosporus]
MQFLKGSLPLLWLGECLGTAVFTTADKGEYKVLPMAADPAYTDACSISAYRPTEKWLGMVTLGGCSLSKKHKNLLSMGASGMLVESLEDAPYDIFSSNNGSFYVVPIGKPLYNMLLNLYLAKRGNGPSDGSGQLQDLPSVQISLPQPKSIPLLQISYVIFLIVMIFVFPVLFDSLEEQTPATLSPKDLSKLPLLPFSELSEATRKYEECPICFDRFVALVPTRTLLCTHYFHSECIDPWLLSRSSRCPVCNHDHILAK